MIKNQVPTCINPYIYSIGRLLHKYHEIATSSRVLGTSRNDILFFKF